MRASELGKGEDKGDQLWANAGKKKKGKSSSSSKSSSNMSSSASTSSSSGASTDNNRPRSWAKESIVGVDTNGVSWGLDVLNWHPPSSPLAYPTSSTPHLHATQNDSPVSMSEDLFLSKSFGESLQPSKVVPYYYRAKGDLVKEDITITTLVTSNRFAVFAKLVERYQGARSPNPLSSVCRSGQLNPSFFDRAFRPHKRNDPPPLHLVDTNRSPRITPRTLHLPTIDVPIRRHPPRHRPLRQAVQHVA